jgi:2-keto-4-pentenoate hydratase/2-oxohepta-3-ene-1,7-dioic acid hydratase in catechol pathway
MLIGRTHDHGTVLAAGGEFRAVPGEPLDYLDRPRKFVEAAASAGAACREPERPLPPLRGPHKIVCVGLNYRSHADEASMATPQAPLLFGKEWDCVSGHGERVRMPRESCRLDYEAELAVVIGRPARRVDVRSARAHIAGYTCFNDLSDRRAQLGDGQWFRGKNFPGSAALGPFIVPAEDLPEVEAAEVVCRVNGEERQRAPVRDMVFDIDQLVAYCSHQFDLLPGDVIATGTPAGVGLTTERWLRPGDIVEVEVTGCGVLSTTIADAAVADAEVMDATGLSSV